MRRILLVLLGGPGLLLIVAAGAGIAAITCTSIIALGFRTGALPFPDFSILEPIAPPEEAVLVSLDLNDLDSTLRNLYGSDLELSQVAVHYKDELSNYGVYHAELRFNSERQSGEIVFVPADGRGRCVILAPYAPAHDDEAFRIEGERRTRLSSYRHPYVVTLSDC